MTLRRLVILCLAFLLPARWAVGGVAAEHAPGEILVGMHEDLGRIVAVSQQIYACGEAVAVDLRTRSVRVRLHRGVSVAAAIADLERRGDVAYAEPNYVRRAFATPNDTSWSSLWGMRKIQADAAWSVWLPHQTAVIAILDTGAQVSHPDLQAQIFKTSGGAVIGYNTITNSTNVADGHSHGTHCSGTAAATINNATGVAGVAGWQGNAGTSGTSSIKIMPVKVLSDSGSGYDSDIAEGITWAADNGAHVISMSLGGPSFSSTVNNAVQYAWGKGVVVVAAAGNGGVSSLSYPAAYTNVLSVAATDSSDKLTSFSQYGSWVKIAAPGLSILSTVPTSSYSTMSGTSMACPHVAGAAALIMAQNASLTPAQVCALLTTNVDPYTPYASGHTIASGAGRLNVYKALLAAGMGVPLLKSVGCHPSTVESGGTASGFIELSAVARTGGEVVTLTSSDPSTFPVSSTVTVPETQSRTTFSVSVGSVSADKAVTITATFGGTTKTAIVNVKKHVVTLDLDQSSGVDLLLQRSSTGAVNYWLLNGTTLSSSGTLSSGGDANLKVIATPDLDDDGKPDVLLQSAATGKIVYWLLSGTTIASSGTLWAGGDAKWKVIATPDLNGDSRPDLLWQHQGNGQLTYWLMNGITKTGGGTLWVGGDATWRVIGTPDLNGDASPDLLWQSTRNGQLTYWLMNGITKTGGGTLWAGGDVTWRVIGTPDLNGDGRPDLLWQSTGNGKLTYWLLNGTTQLASGTFWNGGDAGWKVVLTPDLNGDGSADMIWQYTPNGKVTYWLMDGVTNTSSGTVSNGGDATWKVVAGQ